MTIEESLLQNGLLEREAKVYLALLELGEASVLRVAQKSGIERTYCYDVLESLLKKGLVHSLEKNNRRRYLAEGPEILESILESRVSAFKKVLPELKALYNTADQKPIVHFYEGKEAIIGLYRELEHTLRYDAITSPSLLHKMLGIEVNQVAARMVSKGIKARELVTAEMGFPEYARIFQKPNQEVRLLPKDIAIATDTLIYDNKVVSISLAPQLHAVVTEGSGIITTQRALFEYMWRLSLS